MAERPIQWTDEDLDALSQITPADLAEAEAQWNADMRANPDTRWAQGLLSAEPDEEA